MMCRLSRSTNSPPEQLRVTAPQGLFQSPQKQAFEDHRQRVSLECWMVWREVDPPLLAWVFIEAQPSAGQNDMHMHMESDLLPPTVQYHDQAGLAAKMLGDGSQQRIRRTAKQQPVKELEVKPNQWMRFMGQGEDNLPVDTRQAPPEHSLMPLPSPIVAATWTVAIATTVKANQRASTAIAAEHMAAQRAGTTRGHQLQHMRHIFHVLRRKAQFIQSGVPAIAPDQIHHSELILFVASFHAEDSPWW